MPKNVKPSSAHTESTDLIKKTLTKYLSHDTISVKKTKMCAALCVGEMNTNINKTQHPSTQKVTTFLIKHVASTQNLKKL
jgi:hypothetical protein